LHFTKKNGGLVAASEKRRWREAASPVAASRRAARIAACAAASGPGDRATATMQDPNRVAHPSRAWNLALFSLDCVG
jgi:hypothetical protein